MNLLTVRTCLSVILTLVVLAMTPIPASAEPMRFSLAGSGGNCIGCEWISAQGEITQETPDLFRNYIMENGRPYFIALNSEGGNLLAAIELGEIIRETGATTWIGKTVQQEEKGIEYLEELTPGVCASACVFAFMGGVERSVGTDDMIGVHQFYSIDGGNISSESVQAMVGLTLIHTLRMGVGAGVIAAASNTGPSDIYWFNRDEISALNLDTYSAIDPEPWAIEPYGAGLILKTTSRHGASMSKDLAIFCDGDDGLWRILISEKSDGFSGILEGYAANEVGELKNEIARNSYFLIESKSQKIIHARFSDTVVELKDEESVVLMQIPFQIMRFAERYVSYDPGLPGSFSSFLYVNFVIPKA